MSTPHLTAKWHIDWNRSLLLPEPNPHQTHKPHNQSAPRWSPAHKPMLAITRTELVLSPSMNPSCSRSLHLCALGPYPTIGSWLQHKRFLCTKWQCKGRYTVGDWGNIKYSWIYLTHHNRYPWTNSPFLWSNMLHLNVAIFVPECNPFAVTEGDWFSSKTYAYVLSKCRLIGVMLTIYHYSNLLHWTAN
jgi:hypothetical protein